jgi:hypothetical protein
VEGNREKGDVKGSARDREGSEDVGGMDGVDSGHRRSSAAGISRQSSKGGENKALLFGGQE